MFQPIGIICIKLMTPQSFFINNLLKDLYLIGLNIGPKAVVDIISP